MAPRIGAALAGPHLRQSFVSEQDSSPLAERRSRFRMTGAFVFRGGFVAVGEKPTAHNPCRGYRLLRQSFVSEQDSSPLAERRSRFRMTGPLFSANGLMTAVRKDAGQASSNSGTWSSGTKGLGFRDHVTTVSF